MILGRFIMFPIPGGDLPPIPVDDSPTTVNPMWNDTTPNPGFYETVNSSKLSFQFSTWCRTYGGQSPGIIATASPSGR